MRIHGLYLPTVLFLSLVALVTGCRREMKTDDAPQIEASTETLSLPTNAPQLSSITVESVAQGHPAKASLPGRLVWDEDTTVRVFSPFAGIVRKLPVELNEPVAKGSALAAIQSADFVQAQADARKAESDFRRADQNRERLRDLFEHGAAPKKDLEFAEADFSSAQAELDRARERLAIYGATANSADADFLLPSPLAGILVERNVTPGQEVRPDQMLANAPQFTAPLFVVTDPARLWILIDAAETDLPHLRPGCPFTFTSRGFPGQEFKGTIDVVSQSIDPNTRTVKVRGTVDNPRRLLKAEMFVSVSLPDGNTTAVSVPAKAVFLHGEKHYVFLERSPGRFFRQQVSTGNEADGQILVMNGLEPGQRIVTEGCLLLQESLKQ